MDSPHNRIGRHGRVLLSVRHGRLSPSSAILKGTWHSSPQLLLDCQRRQHSTSSRNTPHAKVYSGAPHRQRLRDTALLKMHEVIHLSNSTPGVGVLTGPTTFSDRPSANIDGVFIMPGEQYQGRFLNFVARMRARGRNFLAQRKRTVRQEDAPPSDAWLERRIPLGPLPASASFS
ncbi:hypothetical protein L227DRAFT_163519 [Lentinus tigrinus ALCF2SS1-6]|uniref:Uncharacterized protein n=1 Tax=Lentinus tigrinus ALCF2SS1-6 TaxID=1328759 RepID=A0A5C2S5R0_9APHY|nr:hypothetical protein L227DRAFT_163519 [Lentinus tigrinus ALCF2SS1-6]